MPRRRLVRFRHLAPCGRRLTIEELADRPTARVRWWDASLNRWITRSLDMPARDDQGRITPAYRVALAKRAEERARSTDDVGPAETAVRRATLHDALELAVHPTLGKVHDEDSQQPREWRRAIEEVRAILDVQRPLEDLGGFDSLLLASSILLRIGAGYTQGEWQEHLEAARTRLGRAQLTVEDLVDAFRRVDGPKVDFGTGQWAMRSVELVRAMLNHAATVRPAEFRSAQNFRPLSDLRDRLKQLAKSVGGALDESVAQGRPPLPFARAVMTYLSDPRQRIHSLLALAVTDDATGRVRRSHMGVGPDGVLRFRPTKRDGSVPTNTKGSLAGWKPMPCRDSSDLLLALIRHWYPQQEAAFLADPKANDYLFLHDLSWDGQTLAHAPGTTWRAIDSRFRLLLILGIENRLTQYHRLTANDVQLTEAGYLVVRSQEKGTKGMSDLFLAEIQVEWLEFEMRCGYLREAHAALRAGQIENYALFPPGPLVRGRMPLADFAPAPHDDSTLAGWNTKLMEIIGMPKTPQTNLRVWRRLFADVYRSWQIPPDVHEALTGHDPVRVRGTVARDHAGGVDRDSSLRVYLNPSDHDLLVLAARVMQHARTDFAATGARCPKLV
ncbi:MAG: hypothetical protein MUF21_00010 [Gemmatimonadaceae bacterium]|jgi:hypothetical protein|nr:hypothetical protein [Gemmatimonadaceae bacterium]